MACPDLERSGRASASPVKTSSIAFSPPRSTGACEQVEVVGAPLGDEVEVGGRAHDAVSRDGDSADDDLPDAGGVEGRDEALRLDGPLVAVRALTKVRIADH